MANVLCQIQGEKRMVIFPPTDVTKFDFEPGASSSSYNVFEAIQENSLIGSHPHETTLRKGDVLFIPPLWLHTASPVSSMSVAVNVFFRDLNGGYAAGRDVYGNRDLQAYEKGRQDITRILKSFDELSSNTRNFYLHRLAAEFQQRTNV
jgi:tRNA wybutosine-synthesizing protein 4